MEAKKSFWVPYNFLALPEEQSRLDRARVVVVPVPYDSTTSFRSGARDGPKAIIEASNNLEDYDPELDADVAEVGIYTASSIEPHMEGPRAMIQRVRESISPFIEEGKLVAVLGGEHSVSIGHVQALRNVYDDLSVLYLDAHGDLRDEYMGTQWGHASVARRLTEICPIVQVGVRDVSSEEMDFIRNKVLATYFFSPTEGLRTSLNVPGSSTGNGTSSVQRLSGSALPDEGMTDFQEIIQRLSPSVYVSIDLDVFDPSIMSAVGTPEPGGMNWAHVISLLRAVAEQRRIVGFDVTELSPGQGPNACAYTAAKLVYKLVAYSTLLSGGDRTVRSDACRDFRSISNV